jgi:hypothetical protein
MQADSETGIFLRKFDRLFESWLICHQARSGQNSFPVGANDSLVDRMRAAEVIRVHYQAAKWRFLPVHLGCSSPARAINHFHP